MKAESAMAIEHQASRKSNDSDSAASGDRTLYTFVLLIFFTSGFAALLYQVIWQRALAHFSGADVYAITIIVTAFMAGLGCGSMVGGHLADRLSPGRRIVAFAVAEFAIAAFALVSLWMYHDLLYFRLNHLAASSVMLPLILFVSLLWPTFFMGMSLPLLARALTHRVERAAGILGWLYGINTLGAAAGALVGTWFFMRTLGFEGTVRLGAVLNAIAAIGALMLRRRLLDRERVERASVDQDESVSSGSPQGADARAPVLTRPAAWFAVYGVSGFIALSLEVIWFRMVGVIIKPTAFSFGNLLGIFLIGLAAGTFIGIRTSRRSTRPAVMFLALQSAIPVYAALSLIIFAWAAPRLDVLSSLWAYLGQYEPIDVGAALSAMSNSVSSPGAMSDAQRALTKQFMLMYFAVPLVIIVPPTLMMGISFPFLQKVVQSDLAFLGRRVGWLQAANIFGSMLGAVLTGWVLLRFFGTVSALMILIALSAVFVTLFIYSVGARHLSFRMIALAGSAVLLAGVAWTLPSSASLWATLHGTSREKAISAEDGSGLSLLKSADSSFSGETTVYANGLGQSDIPFPRWHIALGLLPVMLHPNPQSIAVIGLGSGATLFAAGGREETRKITLIEIVAPQLATLRQVNRVKADPGLRALLDDDRIQYRFADARRFILLGTEKYDVIEADALRPASAYAGNLYSEEYFALLKEHLNTGGFAVTWAPTERVVRTFVKVFDHTLLYRDANIH
ncbi:MAG TPA: fused MFS/spermidine synthase, partial [Gemmatimonadaceae bacterium]|nr:fused MFS/spermidine synthase [Gemmatimonadaceae bacterium]